MYVVVTVVTAVEPTYTLYYIGRSCKQQVPPYSILQLVVASGIERHKASGTIVLGVLHVDLPIGWHGEPHVLRARVPGVLIVAMHVDIFHIVRASVSTFREDLHILSDISVCMTTFKCRIDKNCFSTRRNYIRYSKGQVGMLWMG